MAGNTYLTIDMITKEAVRLFKNSNLFIMNMDTQYDNQFAIDGAKIGDTLRIRLPSDFIVTEGPAMQLQSNTQQFTTLTVSTQLNVATPYTTAERTMSIDNYSELVMSPMINNLAGKVALNVMQGAEGGVCNFVSNVDANGNIISPTLEQYTEAGAVLDENSADMNNRRIAVSPRTDARSVASLAGLLNPATQLSAQYQDGRMRNTSLGFERWFRDQTVINHVSGGYVSGNSTVNGGNQTTGTGGGNINVTALGATLRQGDIITFDGVNSVNRVTKQNLNTLRQFVVTADCAANATSIPVYPGLIPNDPITGNNQQYQTVDNSPLNGAAVRMVTKSNEVYRKSIAYTQKAVTMATADLVLPKKAIEEGARANYDGISVRIITDYLPQSDQLATRVDVLFGKRYIRPEWLVVVADRV